MKLQKLNFTKTDSNGNFWRVWFDKNHNKVLCYRLVTCNHKIEQYVFKYDRSYTKRCEISSNGESCLLLTQYLKDL